MSDPKPATGDANASQSSAQSSVQVPAEVAAQFPDIIALIKSSESMNDEERQYWINILPIMTPEQVQSLRDILANEREQLRAIDEKYAHELEKIGDPNLIAEKGEERSKKRNERQAAEASHKEQEDQTAENILKKIEGGL